LVDGKHRYDVDEKVNQVSAMDDDKELRQRLNQLEQDLRGRALHTQKAAIDELATLPGSLAVPILAQLLQSTDFLQRRVAAMGLKKHQTEEAFQLLAKALAEEQDTSVVAEVADCIFEFGPRAIPLLLEAFRPTGRWLLRHTIIAVFLDGNCYPELLIVAQLALADTVQSVQEVAIMGLGQLLQSPLQQSALELLEALCADPEWQKRMWAASALKNLQNSDTKVLIAQLQKDEHFKVVAVALAVADHWASS
jgi:HEAT repeat protein